MYYFDTCFVKQTLFIQIYLKLKTLLYKHFIWYRFHVMSATTGYVSPSQASSDGTSESRPLNREK